MPRIIITRRVTVTRHYPQPYMLVRRTRGPRLWFHTLMARLLAIGVVLVIAVPVYLHITAP